jgi:hypothetical protein
MCRYMQGIKFFDPQVMKDTPEGVELDGLSCVLNMVGSQLGQRSGVALLDPSAPRPSLAFHSPLGFLFWCFNRSRHSIWSMKHAPSASAPFEDSLLSSTQPLSTENSTTFAWPARWLYNSLGISQLERCIAATFCSSSPRDTQKKSKLFTELCFCSAHNEG